MRSRGRCSGKGGRAGLRRVKGCTGTVCAAAAFISAVTSAWASSSSSSNSCSSSLSNRGYLGRHHKDILTELMQLTD